MKLHLRQLSRGRRAVKRLSLSSKLSPAVVPPPRLLITNRGNGGYTANCPPRLSFVLSTSGRDRPGIVHDLSSHITRMGANIEDSRMTVLGNDFAVLMRVTARVPTAIAGGTLSAAAIRTSVQAEFPSFIVNARMTESEGAPEATNIGKLWRLEVEGPDQKGIVWKLTGSLSRLPGLNIKDMKTEVTTAPFAGYKLFRITCIVELPCNSDTVALEQSLREFEDDTGFDCLLNGEVQTEPIK